MAQNGNVSMLGDFTPSKFSMVHAVADVVLIVGVTVWLNSKINAQNEEWKAENEQLKARVARLEQILQQMMSGTQPAVKEVKQKQSKKVKESPTNSEEEESEEVEQVEVE